MEKTAKEKALKALTIAAGVGVAAGVAFKRVALVSISALGFAAAGAAYLNERQNRMKQLRP